MPLSPCCVLVFGGRLFTDCSQRFGNRDVHFCQGSPAPPEDRFWADAFSFELWEGIAFPTAVQPGSLSAGHSCRPGDPPLSRGAEATAGLDGRVMAIAGSGLHDRREFEYQFEDDRVRDEALGAVVAHFVADGASTVTATPEGIDLQGTCLSRGVTLEPGAVRLDEGCTAGTCASPRTRRAWSDRTSLPGRPAAAVASSVTRARFSSSSSTAP